MFLLVTTSLLTFITGYYIGVYRTYRSDDVLEQNVPLLKSQVHLNPIYNKTARVNTHESEIPNPSAPFVSDNLPELDRTNVSGVDPHLYPIYAPGSAVIDGGSDPWSGGQ
jgi:hypothetical protein